MCLCQTCNGTGLRYWNLLELFKVECKHPNSAWRDTAGFQAFCPACGVEWNPTPENLRAPKGCYVTRLGLAETEGALGGAIGHVMKWTHHFDNLEALEYLKEVLGCA